MFVDTHCHIHDAETYKFALDHQQISRKVLARDPSIPHEAGDFSAERILKRAHKSDVKKLIVVGTSRETSVMARRFASTHKGVYWSFGIHPDEAERYFAAFLAGQDQVGGEVEDDENEPIDDPVAFGEIGLDYSKTTEYREMQIEMLQALLMMAKMDDLPVIFHVRDAFDDFWPIVDNAGVERAVIHSFSDSAKNLEKALDRGFYIGVNGLATFADLPTPPLEKTLLETDAPFLAPVPVRGRVNEPSYVPFIAKFLAEKHGVSVSEIAEVTTRNAEKLFGI